MEKQNRAKSPFLKREPFEEGFFHAHGTYIHPNSIVGDQVQLGENVKIGPFCTIVGNVTIGTNTRLHGYVSVGMPAQDINTSQSLGTIEIGKECEIREFVTIGAPKIDGKKTSIGNNCYVMNFSHVAHDVTLEDNVTLINNVNLGGHVSVGHHTILMANTAVHQHCRIGAHSALAPFSGIRQDLPPFCLFDGQPGRFAGLNLIALKRAGFSRDDLNKLKSITKLFFQDKLPFDTIKKHVQDDELFKKNEYVKAFLEFVQTSDRGISRKTINDQMGR